MATNKYPLTERNCRVLQCIRFVLLPSYIWLATVWKWFLPPVNAFSAFCSLHSSFGFCTLSIVSLSLSTYRKFNVYSYFIYLSLMTCLIMSSTLVNFTSKSFRSFGLRRNLQCEVTVKNAYVIRELLKHCSGCETSMLALQPLFTNLFQFDRRTWSQTK